MTDEEAHAEQNRRGIMTDYAGLIIEIRARAQQWADLGDSSSDPSDWVRGGCGQEILALIDFYEKEAESSSLTSSPAFRRGEEVNVHPPRRDPAVVPHEPTDACRGEHCYTHDVDEPADGAYRVCLECGHAFPTAEALLADHAALASPCSGPAQPPPTSGEPALLTPATDPAQVWSCPHCAHDF